MNHQWYIGKDSGADFALSNGLVVKKVICSSEEQAESVIADIEKVDPVGVQEGKYYLDPPEE